MAVRLRLWWRQIKRPLSVIGIIAVSVLVIALIVGIIGGYIFCWNWTGLGRKTLWDWLQLLIIPLALAIIAIFFNRAERKNEQRIASDNQREAALQEYIKEMSELLLHEKLRKSEEDDEVRTIARVRTLTVLSALDGRRKGSVVQFLYESGLIKELKKFSEMLSVVDLIGANLSEANLSDTILSGVIFRFTNLSNANLSECDLSSANLVRADLHGADLRKSSMEEAALYRATLRGADLREASLIGAELFQADLREVNLSGAFLGKIRVIGGGVAQIETTNSANLSAANMRKAILVKADLTEAYLMDTILIEANLHEARLFGANLQGADLRKADLSRATGTTSEQLEAAKSLKGATMPDGSIHP